MRVTGLMVVLSMVGCGGDVFRAAPLFGDVGTESGVDGALGPDVGEAGFEAAAGDGGVLVDGDRVDGQVLEAAAEAGEESDAGDGAAPCTPLPPLQFPCGPDHFACLLQNGEACLLTDAGGQCLTVDPACQCAETYSCACIAQGATCTTDDAGVVTVSR